MDVGIRELKKRLSEYVDMASKGEHVRVTLRGQPVAHLGPIPGRLRLEEGIAEGWVTPATTSLPSNVTGATGNRSIAQAIAEDRGS